MVAKCVLLVLCYHLLLGGAMSEFTPTVYPAKILSSSQCGQSNTLHDQQLIEVLKQIQQQLPNRTANNTSCKDIQKQLPNCTANNTSCKDIHCAAPSAPSGYYSIRAANGSTVQVYCDMEGTNCGGERGWTRVAYVNMSQPGATCPQGLEQQQINGSLFCGRFSPGLGCICLSAGISGIMSSYDHVCGRVAGYQYDGPDAFRPYLKRNTNISQVYFDGLSIMYSSPRKHIWTYAVGYNYGTGTDACPCNNGSTHQPPPFVGSDYYCESGNPSSLCGPILFSNDTLWDGQQCGGREASCCTHPNMPWFLKTLNETTTEDIELRACTSNEGCTGAASINLIELYVR